MTPWEQVNALPADTVAAELHLERAPGARTWKCPACGGARLQPFAPSAGGEGFKCWSGCGEKSYNNADLAAIVWSCAPVDAMRKLAAMHGIQTGTRTGTGTPPELRRSRPKAAARALGGAVKPDRSPVKPRPLPETDEALKALRADGYTPAEPAAIYRAALEALEMTDAGARYLTGRGLDAADAARYGFRSLDGPADWRRLSLALRASFLPEEIAASRLHVPLWWTARQPVQPAALVIPFWHAGGVIGLRFRNLTPDTLHGDRYRDLSKAAPALPFNADALAGAELHLVEGEINAYTLHSHGLNALGIPGAGRWRNEWAPMLRHAERLVLWFDDDDAGNRGAGTIADVLQGTLGGSWLRARGRRVRTDADANDLHIRGELTAIITRAAWRD